VPDPQLTIITPVYNRPAHLARALRSLTAQTFTDFEGVVVDDASETSPAPVLDEIADPRFRLVSRSVNGGPSAARMTGFVEARGRYVGFLDSDNELYPWAFARAVSLLEQHPEVDGVAGLYVTLAGLPMRVRGGARVITPEDYRRRSTKYDTDCVGVVRRVVVEEWRSRRADFFSAEFHLFFWMSLHHSQLYVDEPWGVYHVDADTRVTTDIDDRNFTDAVKFVEEYRPLLDNTPCVPLDEWLSMQWYTLRRAHRANELAVIEDWMRARGVTVRDALSDAARRRFRRLRPGQVNWV
jgi:glycosyltransferase involved in cell wall biosynthesis